MSTRRALMVALPPQAGAGRTGGLSQDLPRAGWETVPLAPSMRAWAPWWLGVPAGLRLIRRHRPDVIWSGYPGAAAHMLGLALHRLSGIPWVADQPDTTLQPGGPPPTPRARRLAHWIEAQALRYCAGIVCSTDGALRACLRRHPQAGARFSLIGNGYDEASFRSAEQAGQRADAGARRRFRLLHSGAVNPAERDPRFLFAALARMLADGEIGPATFRLVLRGSGQHAGLAPLIARHGLGAIVELAPALPYRETLAELMDADGLLLMQGTAGNLRVPAKLHDYLRARRPILALIDPAGDSGAVLRHAGIDTIGMLDAEGDIGPALQRFLRLCREGKAPLARDATIALHARAARAIELAELFDKVGRKEPS